MFGTDSGKNGWHGLKFIYECTLIYGVIFVPTNKFYRQMRKAYADSSDDKELYFIELRPNAFDRIHENSQAHIEVKVRMERFLSIWEERECHMYAISCENNDSYAPKSQFITNIIGQIMGSKDLSPTPIDTKASLHLNAYLYIFDCV